MTQNFANFRVAVSFLVISTTNAVFYEYQKNKMKMIVGIDDLNRVSTAIDPGSLLYYLDSDIQLPL